MRQTYRRTESPIALPRLAATRSELCEDCGWRRRPLGPRVALVDVDVHHWRAASPEILDAAPSMTRDDTRVSGFAESIV